MSWKIVLWGAFCLMVSLFGTAVGIVAWTLVDRGPVSIVHATEVTGFDPVTRVLAYRWRQTRYRWCPGRLIRGISAEQGGSTMLEDKTLDVNRVTLVMRQGQMREQNASEEGAHWSFPGLETIDKSFGGKAVITFRIEWWCNWTQRLYPIVETPPDLEFELPAVVVPTDGGQPEPLRPTP